MPDPQVENRPRKRGNSNTLMSQRTVLLSLAGATFLFAVGFLFTTHLSGSGYKLRVSATDLLAPIFFLMALKHFLATRHLPTLRLPFAKSWLSAITLWILLELFLSYYYTGSIDTWATLNKGVGWFVLLGYFIIALWFRQTVPNSGHTFILGFIAAAALSSSIAYVSIQLENLGFCALIDSQKGIRALGFMENPNAFGIALASALCMALVYTSTQAIYPKYIGVCVSSSILLSLIFSGSRSAWLGTSLSLLVLLLLRAVTLRTTFLVAMCTSSLLILTYTVPPLLLSDESAGQSARPSAADYVSRDNISGDIGVRMRLRNMQLGLKHWQERPLLGVGLGSHRLNAQQEFGRPHTLHNSLIWILVEMGLLGLTLFTIFFVASFIYIAGPSLDDLRQLPLRYESAAYTGGLLALAGASVGTELIYQRQLWFMLGLGLAAAPRTSEPRVPSTGSMTPPIDTFGNAIHVS